MIAPVAGLKPGEVDSVLSALGGKTKKPEVQTHTEVPLSPELRNEFNSIDTAFTVTTGMLKEIVHYFEKELDAGLQKQYQNIVSLDS